MNENKFFFYVSHCISNLSHSSSSWELRADWWEASDEDDEWSHCVSMVCMVSMGNWCTHIWALKIILMACWLFSFLLSNSTLLVMWCVEQQVYAVLCMLNFVFFCENVTYLSKWQMSKCSMSKFSFGSRCTSACISASRLAGFLCSTRGSNRWIQINTVQLNTPFITLHSICSILSMLSVYIYHANIVHWLTGIHSAQWEIGTYWQHP